VSVTFLWLRGLLRPESPVFWRVSGLVHLSGLGLADTVVLDVAGPSPAASSVVSPGVWILLNRCRLH